MHKFEIQSNLSHPIINQSTVSGSERPQVTLQVIDISLKSRNPLMVAPSLKQADQTIPVVWVLGSSLTDNVLIQPHNLIWKVVNNFLKLLGHYLYLIGILLDALNELHVLGSVGLSDLFQLLLNPEKRDHNLCLLWIVDDYLMLLELIFSPDGNDSGHEVFVCRVLTNGGGPELQVASILLLHHSLLDT